MGTIRALRVVVAAGLFAVIGSASGFTEKAQQAASQAGTNSSASDGDKQGPPNASSTAGDANTEKQEAEQKPTPPMTDKQKKLAADTEKLLALARELKQQVDKTNKNVLSVSVVKKAEEIERLAKSVKTEMK